MIHRSRRFSHCGLHPFQRCFTTQERGVLPPPKCQARAKRRRNILLRDNLRILELLGRGETRDNVASEYDISLTTICVIKREEDKIRSFVSSVNNDACLNRRMCVCQKTLGTTKQSFSGYRSIHLKVSRFLGR